MERKIKAALIFEILGRPADYIQESLSKLIDSFNQLPGIKVTKKEVHEAKPVEKEEARDMFTSFAEVEMEAEKIESLLAVIFNAYPAHIEIIEPDECKLKNFEISTLLTDLIRKLHQYDEVARGLAIERNILMKQMEELRNSSEESKSNKKKKLKKK